MRYHNPLRILQPEPAEWQGSARQFFKRVQRRLLAEFEVTGSVTIDLNGQYMDRDQVLKLVEEVSRTTDLAYHLQLLRYPDLMDFLETKRDEAPLREIASSMVRKGMDHYLEPILLPRLQEVFGDALEMKSTAGLLHLSRVADLLSPKQQAQLFQPFVMDFLQWLDQWKENMASGKEEQPLRDQLAVKRALLRLLPPYFEKMQEMYQAEAKRLSPLTPPRPKHHEIKAFLASESLELQPIMVRELVEDVRYWRQVGEKFCKLLGIQLRASLIEEKWYQLMQLSACFHELDDDSQQLAAAPPKAWLEKEALVWQKQLKDLSTAFLTDANWTLKTEQLELYAQLPACLQPSVAKLKQVGKQMQQQRAHRSLRKNQATSPRKISVSREKQLIWLGVVVVVLLGLFWLAVQ